MLICVERGHSDEFEKMHTSAKTFCCMALDRHLAPCLPWPSWALLMVELVDMLDVVLNFLTQAKRLAA